MMKNHVTSFASSQQGLASLFFAESELCKPMSHLHALCVAWTLV
jgi:hypothetical protein